MKKNRSPIEINNTIQNMYPHVSLDISSYIDTNHTARFIDSEYGEFFTRVHHVLKGYCHPKRGVLKFAVKQTYSLDFIKDKLKENYGDMVKIKESTYTNASSKAVFIDSEYGEWECKPSSVISKTKSMHPKRAKKNAALKLKISIDEIEKRIFNKHKDLVKIIKSTYIGVNSKAMFLDKDYGIYESTVWSVISSGSHHPKRAKELRIQTNLKKYGKQFILQVDKIKDAGIQTNLKKYGVKSPSQNKDIAFKMAKSNNKSTIRYHWKTNEELVCIGSYEVKAIDYLNKHQIDYQWQPQVFTTPIKTPKNKFSTYRPDLYIPSRYLWIEIKGYFRDDAEDKWNWFSKNYNAELWDTKRLKELRIL